MVARRPGNLRIDVMVDSEMPVDHDINSDGVIVEITTESEGWGDGVGVNCDDIRAALEDSSGDRARVSAKLQD
jgi:hypothetical protein